MDEVESSKICPRLIGVGGMFTGLHFSIQRFGNLFSWARNLDLKYSAALVMFLILVDGLT